MFFLHNLTGFPKRCERCVASSRNFRVTTDIIAPGFTTITKSRALSLTLSIILATITLSFASGASARTDQYTSSEDCDSLSTTKGHSLPDGLTDMHDCELDLLLGPSGSDEDAEQNPEGDYEDDYYGYFDPYDFEHYDPSEVDLSAYEWDPSSADADNMVCHITDGGESYIPGPYLAGPLTHRWYEPIGRLNPDLAAKYPPVYLPQRKKALIIIHGWQGFDKTTSRQKRRLIHNAKEDIVSSSSLLLGKRGLDLSFTSVLGTPYGDDLGAMLQCLPTKESGIPKREVSLVDHLDQHGIEHCQLDDSYQVGWWDWSPVSYDRKIKDAEKSLWLSDDDQYISDDDLISLYKQMVADLAPGTQLTVMGHSLGAGLSIRLYKAVTEAAVSGEISAEELMLSRLILADPYFTNRGVLALTERATLLPFDTSYWPGQKARSALEDADLALTELRSKTDDPALKNHFVAVDIYSTRQDHTEFFSDANRPLKLDSDLTVYIDLVVGKGAEQELVFTRRKFPHPLLFWLDNWLAHQSTIAKRKHLYPLFWVLDTLARSSLPKLCGSEHERPSHRSAHSLESDDEAASKLRDYSRSISGATTKHDLSQVWRSGKGHAWYRQSEGIDTLKTEDDAFCYQVHKPAGSYTLDLFQ